MTNKRNLSYDLIRTVAIAMVVMIHVSAYMVTYSRGTENATFVVGNIFNALARAGTPMFMMLSGALLLDEKRAMNPRDFYRKKPVIHYWGSPVLAAILCGMASCSDSAYSGAVY